MRTMTLTQAINSVAEAIRQIQSARPEENETTAPDGLVMFSRGDLGGMSLTGDTARIYGAALDTLWSAVRPLKVLGKHSVEASLQTAVLQAFDAAGKRPDVPFERRLKGALAQLKTSLASPPMDWQIHLQIFGMVPNAPPQRLAGVVFRTMTPAVIRSLKRRANAVLDETADQPETKARLKKKSDEQFAARFAGRTFAEVRVRAADAEAALTQARQRLRVTLDIINFFADLLYTPSLRPYVYAGDREATSNDYLTFQDDQEVRLTGGPRPRLLLPLSDLRLARARRLRAPVILRWLADESRDGFQTRVLSAFQWAGRASADDRPEEGFLLYLIALESLILGDTAERELSYRLKVRCAHLLGRTREQRSKIAAHLAPLYTIRSKIVHAGWTGVSDQDLASARKVVKLACLAMVSGRIKPSPRTSKDLEQWFERQILGSQR
jgi:hypothetical protein